MTTRARALWLLGLSMFLEGYMTLAQAEVKPYVAASYIHTDNLFRLSDRADPNAVIGSGDRSDNYRRLEAGVDMNAQASRQKFNLQAGVNQTRFERFNFLDNGGGSGRAVWDGEIGSAWRGRAGYEYARSLSAFEVLSGGKNIRTDRRGFGELDYRIFPSWRIRAGADNYDVKNSLTTRQTLDNRTVSRAIGLHYVNAAEDYLGVQSKSTDGSYPNPENINGVSVDNGYDETENGLVMDWRPAGHSRLRARASYTERRYAQLPARDYQGPTARLIYDWNLSEKTLANAVVWRELTIADDLSASYVLSKGINLGPKWSATPKVTLRAGLGHEIREYRGDPRLILTALNQRSDRLNAATFSADYLPSPKIQMGLGYETGRRTSTQALSDYRYRNVSGNLRVEF